MYIFLNSLLMNEKSEIQKTTNKMGRFHVQVFRFNALKVRKSYYLKEFQVKYFGSKSVKYHWKMKYRQVNLSA